MAPPTQVALQGFRAVIVTPMGISTPLADSVAGGVRQRLVSITLVPANWKNIMAIPPSKILIGTVVYLCVV